jgi:glycerate kinase
VRGVVELCAQYNKPVIALCGAVDVDARTLQHAGLTAAFSIINRPMPVEAAMQHAAPLLTEAACNIGNFFKTAYSR